MRKFQLALVTLNVFHETKTTEELTSLPISWLMIRILSLSQLMMKTQKIVDQSIDRWVGTHFSLIFSN